MPSNLGRVVASILADPVGHAGQVYPLFGPKELTQFEIAGMLSEVLGRKITYVPMEIEAFKGVLKDMGHTPHLTQHVSAVAQDCRDGIFSGTWWKSLQARSRYKRWITSLRTRHYSVRAADHRTTQRQCAGRGQPDVPANSRATADSPSSRLRSICQSPTDT